MGSSARSRRGQSGRANAASRSRRLSGEDRRNQIIAAARQVFLRSGFTGARVREISEAAGVNGALVYNHFDSKEELFEAAIAEPLEAAVGELTERGLAAWPVAVVSASERRERVVEFVDQLVGLMLELAPLLGVMLFADPERGRDFYRKRFTPAVTTLADAVQSADESWEHRDFDPRLVVISALATCLMLALDYRFGGSLLDDRQRVVRSLTENILEGLEPRPGD